MIHNSSALMYTDHRSAKQFSQTMARLSMETDLFDFVCIALDFFP